MYVHMDAETFKSKLIADLITNDPDLAAKINEEDAEAIKRAAEHDFDPAYMRQAKAKWDQDNANRNPNQSRNRATQTISNRK